MKWLKQSLFAIASAGLLLLAPGIAQKVHAASTDTITLSVTPGGVSYAVQITSPMGVGYQFGTVTLGQTTGSTVAIGVRNAGTISEYFVMKAANSSPDNWAPVAGTPGTDQYQLMGWFSGVAGVQPPDGSFADAVGTAFNPTGATKYNQGGKTIVNATNNLFLRLAMPSALNAGSGGAQTMTLFIAAQGT